VDRRKQILANLRLDGLGLEIGPSHSPVAAGTPGLRVQTLDFMDQAGLIARYDRIGQDTSRIRPVDYVWSGEPYSDLVGETRFDWIVASHVVEHVPDLIGFIADCAEVLAPGGVLSLAVPDKRGIFDYYRPPSGLGQVIDAHLPPRSVTSAGAAAEFELNYAEFDGETGTTRFPHDPFRVRQVMARVAGGEFLDIHAWVFTPSSLRLLVEDLHALRLLPMRESGFAESIGYEFYLQLRRDGAGPGVDRPTLARRALDELSWVSAPEVERLGRRIADLEAELDATRRTLSWRLTAPLRAMRRGGWRAPPPRG